MEAAPGLEPGMEVLQTSALPLGYAAISSYDVRQIKMEQETGLEPATTTLATWGSTN